MSDDTARCPCCNSLHRGLGWEYNWNNEELDSIETECDECGRPIKITRLMTVSYEIDLLEEKDG